MSLQSGEVLLLDLEPVIFFSAFLSNKVAPALNAAIKTADREKRMHLNVSYQHKLSSPNCINDTHVAVFTAVCGVENDNLRWDMGENVKALHLSGSFCY